MGAACKRNAELLMVRRRCYGVLHLSQHFGGPDRGPALTKSWHLGAGKQVRTPCGHYFHEDCLRLTLEGATRDPRPDAMVSSARELPPLQEPGGGSREPHPGRGERVTKGSAERCLKSSQPSRVTCPSPGLEP